MRYPTIRKRDKHNDPPEWVEVQRDDVAILFAKAIYGVKEVSRRNVAGKRGWAAKRIHSDRDFNEMLELARRTIRPDLYNRPAPAPPLPGRSTPPIRVVERPRYADPDLLDPETRILGSIARAETPNPVEEKEETPPPKQGSLF